MYDLLEPEIDKMKKSGIVITKELLPTQLCDEIIGVYENTVKTQPSHVQKSDVGDLREFNPMYRDDRFICLDEASPWSSELPKLVNEHISRALYEYFEYFPVLNTAESALYSIRQKLQKTDVAGGFHVWHYENGHIDSVHRMLAWTIYLNDVPEGGETEFLYQSERVKPVKGRTVIFPAGFMHTHRGNPPISNEKYILTGWFSIRMMDTFF
tara:strand:- start:405 stop:1037 length:633 start_codon:yes stop_codon:yes gene_type:complete